MAADALAVEGLQAALDRDCLDCGIDALFIEVLRTPEQMDAACRRFAQRVPLLANMVEGGKTPPQSADELGARCFRIVNFPGEHRWRRGAHAGRLLRQPAPACASLRQHGSTAPWRRQMLDFDGLNVVIGTNELLAQARRYDWSVWLPL